MEINIHVPKRENEENEEWRDTDYKGYQISSLGRVKGPRGFVIKSRPAPDNSNSLVVRIFIDKYQYKHVKVHKLVCLAFICSQPLGTQAMHKDGDKKNNRADNLYWGVKNVRI